MSRYVCNYSLNGVELHSYYVLDLLTVNRYSRGMLDGATEVLSSRATTLPYPVGESKELSDTDQVGDDAVSLVTASTTSNFEDILRLPSLVDLSPNDQPFKCPICCTLQSFQHEKAWE